MTDEIVTAEPVAIEPTAPAPEAGFSSEVAETVDHEAKARELGWKPETEWKGDKPSKFYTAEEWLDRSETLIPVLNKRLAKQEEDFAKRLARIEKVNDRTLKAAESAHKKELAELANAARWAASQGDLNAYDAYTAQFDEAKKNGPGLSDMEPTAPLSEEAMKEAVRSADAKFAKENPWYGKDFKMTKEAEEYSTFLANNDPNLSIEDNRRRTAEYVREQYPAKFSGTKGANSYAPVDGGGAFNGPAKDPLAKLPAEARQQAKSDMQKYPKIYPTPDAWVKAYNS